MTRLITNICSNKLQQSRDFYLALFDFTVKFDSDWYVQLCSVENADIELGIIDSQHDLVPSEYRGRANGFYVTLVVNDVDKVHKLAKEQGIEIMQPPQDQFYGQRRMLIKDPNDCLIDVSSPIST